MNLKLISILTAAFIILIVLAFLGGRWTAPKEFIPIEKPYPVEKVKFDTIEKEIRLQTIIKTFKSDSIVYIDSTKTIETKPFIAVKDTILQGDTIGVKYAFPQDSFYLKVLPKPLVIKEVIKTEYLINTVEIKRPLWIDILSHTGAGLIGYFIGSK